MLMIIICPSCKKKFDLSESLIPDKGRLLKCGSCDQTWFFHKKNSTNTNIDVDISSSIDTKTTDNYKSLKKKKKDFKKDILYTPQKKGSELIKYKSKSNFTFGKLLSYLIVIIISFTALILIMDTFKNPLSIIFPNIELILYNLFETIRDLFLFAKDLSQND